MPAVCRVRVGSEDLVVNKVGLSCSLLSLVGKTNNSQIISLNNYITIVLLGAFVECSLCSAFSPHHFKLPRKQVVESPFYRSGN